jgi:transcriptional antiterminator RfaH
LRRQGYETLLPLREATLRRARRLVARRVPLFPSYLFVRLDAASCRNISSTRGVSQLITGDGGRPRRVDGDIITEIRANCDAEGLYSDPEDVVAGDQVEILCGPFASAVAEVSSIASADRLWVFLEIMDRSVKLNVSRRNVASAI